MPTESYEPGDVVVVPFPFTDSAATKRRPALVISAADFQRANGHLVLGMITSAKHSQWSGDVRLRDWRQAGLPQPSILRLKLFTLDEQFVLRKLGRLSADDEQAVRGSLKQYLALAGG